MTIIDPRMAAAARSGTGVTATAAVGVARESDTGTIPVSRG
jgi:hypothetical protein